MIEDCFVEKVVRPRGITEIVPVSLQSSDLVKLALSVADGKAIQALFAAPARRRPD
jgi:hypothetical protein